MSGRNYFRFGPDVHRARGHALIVVIGARPDLVPEYMESPMLFGLRCWIACPLRVIWIDGLPFIGLQRFIRLRVVSHWRQIRLADLAAAAVAAPSDRQES